MPSLEKPKLSMIDDDDDEEESNNDYTLVFKW